jgi:hypothetical protein
MNITWIPTADQVGSQVFCAIAEDRLVIDLFRLRDIKLNYYVLVPMFNQINIV